jgi:hypothetical protein
MAVHLQVHARRDRDVALILADLRQQRAIAIDTTKTAAQRKNARQQAALDRCVLELLGQLPSADNIDTGEA